MNMDPEDFFKEEGMSFETFVSKLYNLREFDKQVYVVLLKSKKPMRCEMVKKKVDRDTVAVYRALQKLTKAGLCQKDRRPLKSGGHYMEYSAISHDDAREPLQEKLDLWYKECKMIIDNR